MNTQNIKTAASESSERCEKAPNILRYIRLAKIHMSMKDALTLSYLSDPVESGESYSHEWIHDTGMHNGFIIRLDAHTDALERLATLGVTPELCEAIRHLTESLSVSLIHFDDDADTLAGLPVYDW